MKSDKELIASGLACVNLTPDIKKTISSMQGNEILKVTNDDPASRLGVPAWCRLTGHALLDTQQLNEQETVFYIQKKNS
ncbi:MAG TPA: sulfurtransferase TusA family protein [Chitinophagaceae bacterium]|nr:sulfurtransferase TusA family protein [Chitinophagaceae bacterium]